MTSPETAPSSPRWPQWTRLMLPAVIFLLCVVLLQWFGGAYESGFGGEPDEAAHYVTGLCVRDYFAAGCPGNPLAYAKQYYDHYPKVALGHWPPFFYLIQAAWTLPFTPGRASVLILMAALTAAIATLMYAFLKKEFGAGWAFGGALLFIALPLVQKYSGDIMTEIPITLLSWLAALNFGRFLDREKTVHAAAFGLFAALAVLTKQSALALVFVPVVAVGLTGKFHLLKRFAFWLPAVIVFGLCAPWTLLTYKLASEGSWASEGWGWNFTHAAIPYYLLKSYLATGIAVTGLMLAGMAVKLFCNKSPEKPAGTWPAFAGLLVGVVVFHLVVPVGYEARHLIPALPAAVIFAVAGAAALAGRLSQLGIRRPVAGTMVLGLTVSAFAFQTFQIPEKGCQGFDAAADFFLKDPGAKNAVVLVASDARGEGMFISEVAMRERRPGHVVRRASKDLASSSWGGGNYHAKFADASSLADFLHHSQIRFIVLDTSIPADNRKDYHELLARVLEQKGFSLERRFDVERAGEWHAGGLKLYRVTAD